MKRVTFSIFIFTTFAFSGAMCFAQVGKDSGLWEWTPKDAAHLQPIVEISSNGGTGTGVIVSVDTTKPIKDGFEGYCLTANHVVQDDNGKGDIKVRFRNGRKSKGCRVVQSDKEKDIALIWVWVPKGITPAKLAPQTIKGGDKIEFAGLGGGSTLDTLRSFSAIASPPSSGEKIFADVPLLPGDSGGPVFNADHEVVGIISGGWFWFDGGVKTASGSEIKTTWPARASNVSPIKVMVAKNNQETTTTTSR